MKIQKQDLFHGAALMQVVEDPRFKALNKASDSKYGHYVLNNDTRLFVKYTTGDGPNYLFNLSVEDVELIKKDQLEGHRVFAVLVCGQETICAIPSDELWLVVEEAPGRNQKVWVQAEPGKSMRFGRGKCDLGHAIAHNSFPAVVLD